MNSAPKRIPFYDAKFNYLYLRKWGLGSECPIAKEKGIRGVDVSEMHHAGIHNDDTSRAIYPLVVHSLINFILVSGHYHKVRGFYGRKGHAWASKWQKFLENPAHYKCKRFLNEVWCDSQKLVIIENENLQKNNSL